MLWVSGASRLRCLASNRPSGNLQDRFIAAVASQVSSQALSMPRPVSASHSQDPKRPLLRQQWPFFAIPRCKIRNVTKAALPSAWSHRALRAQHESLKLSCAPFTFEIERVLSAIPRSSVPESPHRRASLQLSPSRPLRPDPGCMRGRRSSVPSSRSAQSARWSPLLS